MFFSVFPPVALQPFDEDQSRASQVASFIPKRILGNSAIPRQGKTPGCHFVDFFTSVGPPSPTSKVQHRLKFLAFKTCPNCIGRSWNSCIERPVRQLHSSTAMFATKHLRPPNLHEAISHHCLQKTRQTRTVPTSKFMPVQSTEMSIPCKNQHLLLVWYVSVRRARRTFSHTLTECLSKREKSSTSRRGAGASYQTSHPGISARAIAFGRSWPIAAFCYRPCLPVRH